MLCAQGIWICGHDRGPAHAQGTYAEGNAYDQVLQTCFRGDFDANPGDLPCPSLAPYFCLCPGFCVSLVSFSSFQYQVHYVSDSYSFRRAIHPLFRLHFREAEGPYLCLDFCAVTMECPQDAVHVRLRPLCEEE